MNSPNTSNITFKIKTLGCKVNQYEEELIRENLLAMGLRESDRDEAGVYIVNSCTVTHRADSDTRRIIRNFYKKNPGAIIIVTGCYTELQDDKDVIGDIKGVSKIFGNKEKRMIPGFIAEKLNMRPGRFSESINRFSGHDRAFVKIQDGCDNRCSYCKVSIVRGKSVSRGQGESLNEARSLVDAGFKEIVLTGVCLGAWGTDFKVKKDISDILQSIDSMPGNFRVRISSIEPKYVTDRFIETVAGCLKVCRHLHIPIQSGDDSILASMNRGYTSEDIIVLVKKIRRMMPDIGFSTDLIVGFPGENEKTFNNTFGLLKEIEPSRMHIFSYSKRMGTAAAGFPGTPHPQAVKSWLKKYENLSGSLSVKFAKGFIGKSVAVLVESEKDRKAGLLTGYTGEYIKVLIDGPESSAGQIVNAKVKTVGPDNVAAVLQ